jgi:hypothetical protein
MCFSATASFTAAALLVPVGIASIRSALAAAPCQGGGTARLALALAVSPLIFALQQAIEGVVWLGVVQHPPALFTDAAALAYLFFAYAFWPFWMPFAALRFTEERATRQLRWVLRVLVGLGFVLGMVLWLPLLFAPGPLAPQLVQGSLHYRTGLVFADQRLNDLGRAIYVAIICLPLLLAASRGLMIFAVGLLAAVALAEAVNGHAFTSVWCYFSAMLSGLILWIVGTESDEAAARPASLTS